MPSTHPPTESNLRQEKHRLYVLRTKYHDEGKFYLERDILKEIVGSLSRPRLRQLAGLSEEQIVICRSQIKALDARLMMEKGASLASVAQAYLDAANTSVIRRRRKFRVHADIEEQHHSFLASHHKFSAFALLSSHNTDWPRIIGHLTLAVDHATQALQLRHPHEEGRHEGNIEYLSYWLHIVEMRHELSKPSKDFDKALALLDTADRCAQFFKPAEMIFPNRFYSLTDLRNEAHLIKGFRAFCGRKFNQCIEDLTAWRDASVELEGSWRYHNVIVRLLISEFLHSLTPVAASSLGRTGLLRRMSDIARQESVGLACLELIHHAELMENLFTTGLLTEARDSVIFGKMVELFPLDSQAEEIRSISLHEKFRRDQLETLPRCFAELFQAALLSLDRRDVDACRNRLTDLVKNLLLISADYHFTKAMASGEKQWLKDLPREFGSNFEAMSPDELLDALILLAPAVSKETLLNRETLDGLKSFMKALPTQPDLRRAVEYVQDEVINKLSVGIVPHIVFVEERCEPSAEVIEFRVRRIWKRGVPEVLRLYRRKGEHCGKRDELQENEFYYLRTGWRRHGYRRFPLCDKDFEVYPAKLLKRLPAISSYMISGVLPWEGDVGDVLRGEEGPCLEFKPAEQLPYGGDILEWMIAFGNNYPHGGMLILGVSNKKSPETGQRTVFGFEIHETFVNRLYQKVHSQVSPLMPFQLFRADWQNKQFPIIHVPSFGPDATDPYVLKDKAETHFRDGASTNRYTGFQSIRERFLAQMTVAAGT